MENGAEAAGGIENVSVFHYIWGQGGKSLRALEKKRGKSQLKRSSCVCCFCLLSHFKSAVWNRRRIKVGSAAIGPGQPRRPGWSHFHQCWLSKSGKGESLQPPVLNPVPFQPFLQKPPAAPTTPASCSLTQPLGHLPSEGHGPLGGITPVAQSLTGPHCPREFLSTRNGTAGC